MPKVKKTNHRGVTPEYAEMREAILHAAAEVFSAEGFVAGTTKDIAARVGLSQPAIYHYVGSKQVLLNELAVRVDHDILSALKFAEESSTEPREQLATFIHELTKAIINDRQMFAVYWAETRWVEPSVLSEIRADERKCFTRLERLVSKVQADGGLPSSPKSVVTMAILGMSCWTSRWYQPRGPMTPSQIAGVFCELIGLESNADSNS